MGLLPSSTLPVVVNLRISICSSMRIVLKITLFLAVFHRSFRAFIITPVPAFSLAAGSHFSYDLFERISLRFNATSDGNITQGTETNHFAFHLLAIAQLQMIRNRQPEIGRAACRERVCQYV